MQSPADFTVSATVGHFIKEDAAVIGLQGCSVNISKLSRGKASRCERAAGPPVCCQSVLIQEGFSLFFSNDSVNL